MLPYLQKNSFYLTAMIKHSLLSLLPNCCYKLLLCSVLDHTNTHRLCSSRQISTDTLSNGTYRLQLFKGCHVITVLIYSPQHSLAAFRVSRRKRLLILTGALSPFHAEANGFYGRDLSAVARYLRTILHLMHSSAAKW